MQQLIESLRSASCCFFTPCHPRYPLSVINISSIESLVLCHKHPVPYPPKINDADGWIKYFHDAHVLAASWKGSAQAAYYFGDFSLNANLETPHKTAGYDLKVTKTPWLYGLHVSWSKKGLQLGAGVNNFFQTDSKYHTRLDTGIYKYTETSASHLSSFSAYIKIGWSIDYGKKTKHDTRDIDKNIQSGILKAN